jgi:hypothetical protein
LKSAKVQKPSWLISMRDWPAFNRESKNETAFK